MTFSLRIKVHLVYGKKKQNKKRQERRYAESWRKGKAGKLVDIGKRLWTEVQNFEYDVIGNYTIAFMTKNKEDLYTELGIRIRSCGESKNGLEWVCGSQDRNRLMPDIVQAKCSVKCTKKYKDVF